MNVLRDLFTFIGRLGIGIILIAHGKTTGTAEH